MIVIIASECTGSARDRSQKVLDGFFKRIGRRAWSGRITSQGLTRLRRELAAVATKNTAICCHRIVGRRALEVSWFVGNRDRFDSRGYCVVNETERDLVKPERVSGSFELGARRLSILAALFHDLGKFTAWFQQKLRQSKPKHPISDYVRHEFISFVVMKALFTGFPTDRDCLECLSDPDHAAISIAKAFKKALANPDLYAFAEETERLSSFKRTIMRSKADAKDIAYPGFAERPILSLLSDAVLTHHRLTGARLKKGDRAVVPSVEELIRNRYVKDKYERLDERAIKDLEKHFQLPSGINPIWEDSSWISQVSKACASILERYSDVAVTDRKSFSIVGRTALVLADHKASSYGNTAFPAGDTEPDRNLAYANTNRGARKGELAEPLASHLVRVAEDCDLAYDILFTHIARFPGMAPDDIPASIAEPRDERGSPFRWQTDASRATRKAMKNAPKSGFFGVLMADTGTGKTRGSSIIMSAATGAEGASQRLSVCSGLRTLTLQTGREYTTELKFPEDAVSVVIGDEITADLFRLEMSSIDTGSQTDDLEGVDVLPMGDAPVDRPLPEEVHDFIGASVSTPTVALLSSPVLISTIDTLMPAADGRRTGQIPKTLRVATSDLILDEIDNFEAEDIVAIARLVYLHGVFGRRVLISSATVYPGIAKCLFEAYHAGWKVHETISGQGRDVVVGWYSNKSECICEPISSASAFEQRHGGFVAAVLSAPSFIRRRGRISAPMRRDDAAAYFRSVSAEIGALHEDNHILDERSGRRFSIGVVKWNNALPSILYASRLTIEGLGQDVDVFVVPYNGTLQAGPRHVVESNLNRVLKRKPVQGRDPILADALIRDLLDNRSTQKDVIVVVVTTSMEETGRDHDFDWAILEPGSQRSLIQIAGRVRRHRPAPYDGINVVVMEYTFREARYLEAGNRKTDVFAYPGFQTPISEDALKVTVPSTSARDCYDLEALAVGIDARDAVSSVEPTGAIAQAERALANAYLDGSILPDFAGVADFLSDEMSFIHGHNMARRRFRRSSGTDFKFVYQDEYRGWGVVVGDAMQTCRSVDEFEIDEGRLLLRIGDPFELRARMAKEIWGEEGQESWKAQSLLAVTRPLHGDNPHSHRFLAHPALGFLEEPRWLERLDLG